MNGSGVAAGEKNSGTENISVNIIIFRSVGPDDVRPFAPRLKDRSTAVAVVVAKNSYRVSRRANNPPAGRGRREGVRAQLGIVFDRQVFHCIISETHSYDEEGRTHV